MVARRGRGARAQAAKAKAQEQPEVQNEVEENNGEAEQQQQQSEEQPAGDGDNGDQNTSQESMEPETTDAETTENPTESTEAERIEEQKDAPKVEPGKILVENLPPSYLFDYQEKLKELFSKHGEVNSVKRGPMIVTELTTAPTLSAIVEFKNKDSVEKALTEQGTELDGHSIAVAEECRPETAVLVGVPYEATSHYVKELFQQCGDITNINEFSKNKYKILRVTFSAKEGVEKALKLDRELRINGFLVTVSQYRDNDEHKNNQNNNKNKRNSSTPGRTGGGGGQRNGGRPSFSRPPVQPPPQQFNPRPAFRGGRGGAGGRGGGGGAGFGRGGFSRFPPGPSYLPPPHHNYIVPQGPQNFMNDGQRPNKRLRQM